MSLLTVNELEFDATYPIADSDAHLQHQFLPMELEQWSELAIIEEIEINGLIDEIEIRDIARRVLL